jgi:hypothetical protein
MQLLNGKEGITPTKDDAALAEESGRVLAAHLGRDADLRLEVKGADEELKLPATALRILVRVLSDGQGQGARRP